MNDTNIVTYEVNAAETPLDRRPGRTSQLSRQLAGNLSTIRKQPNRQVREDKEIYSPDLLSNARFDTDPKAHSAAADNAKHLRKAERLLDEALNLAGLMLASLGDEGDSRAMQTEAALKVIENKLGKAHTQIDKHHRCHTKLFLAYFSLKDKACGREQN